MSVLPTFQAAGTAVEGTAAITVAWPTHQVNDIALLFVESANQAIALTTANGFVEVTNSPQGTGTAAGVASTRLAIFWARATSAAMASPVVTDPGDHAYGRIITFRGCKLDGDPINITAGNVDATAVTAVTIPGATTTVDNCLVVLAVANATDTTVAQTSGYTNVDLGTLVERADANVSTSGNGGGIAVATGTKAVAGAYTGTTATLATASVQGRISLALAPQETEFDGNFDENSGPGVFFDSDMGRWVFTDGSLIPAENPAIIYVMRGFDTNGSVNHIVFWNSPIIDTGAFYYTGSAGPVTGIVVHKVIC